MYVLHTVYNNGAALDIKLRLTGNANSIASTLINTLPTSVLIGSIAHMRKIGRCAALAVLMTHRR